MASPVDKDEGLRLRITWDSTKGSCASRFQDLTPTLASWLWSAVCHVCLAPGFQAQGCWLLSQILQASPLPWLPSGQS